MSGTSDLVVAGGVQNMSQIPISSAMTLAEPLGFTDPFSGSKGWVDRYGTQEVSQFRGAEMIAEKWDISREDMERFALREPRARHPRHRRGPLRGGDRPLRRRIATDEGPRRGHVAREDGQAPALAEGGRLTAAVASQISDGASCMLVASEQAVKQHGLKPRARVHHMSRARATIPIYMLTAPIPATRYALESSGMKLDQMDAIEINEAFASVVLAWEKELHPDMSKVNPNGGAIALGHPIGATGTRLMTTLLGELERTGGRYGLQTMCEGGGQANVTVIERLG